MFRRGLLIVPVLAALLGAAPPAGTSSIDELVVGRSGQTVTVSGSASFADARVATVGSDDTGDAAVAGIGGDLTGAEIGFDGSTLRFTLGIADELPGVFTVPEFTHYHWQITVTNGTETTNYLLQAMRSGQYDRVLPSASPLFRVNACGELASGAPSCFDHLAYVDGTMADGHVEWRVPADLIHASEGSIVAEGAKGVTVVGGASGAVYGTPELDAISTTPFVVGPSVLVSIEDGAGFVRTAEVATLGPDGTFVAKLAAPSGSGFEVVVRACDGDASTCAEARAALPD